MTTSEDVLIREVDDDLNQDRQLAAFKRYGPFVGIALVLILVGVGAWQVREARQETARAEASEAYDFALNETAGTEALFEYADTAPVGGYRALALMRAAATAARGGERVRAIEAYARVYGDEGLPLPLRDLARVRAGYLALDDGGTAAEGIVSAVSSEAFRPYAAEIAGLSAMARGDYAGAVGAFGEAAASGSGATARAQTFLALARAGQGGVALEASEDPDDFLGEFGRALSEGRLDLPGTADDAGPDETDETDEPVAEPQDGSQEAPGAAPRPTPEDAPEPDADAE